MIEKIKRWNFEVDGDEVVVCKDDHSKDSPCEYVPISNKELLGLVEQMRRDILKSFQIPSNLVSVNIQQSVYNQLFVLCHKHDYSTSEAIQYLIDNQTK